MGLFDHGVHALLKVLSSGTSLQNVIPTPTHFLPCPGFISPAGFPHPWFPAGSPAGSPIQLVPVSTPRASAQAGIRTLDIVLRVCLSISDSLPQGSPNVQGGSGETQREGSNLYGTASSRESPSWGGGKGQGNVSAFSGLRTRSLRSS